jgi:hypothetical protein
VQIDNLTSPRDYRLMNCGGVAARSWLIGCLACLFVTALLAQFDTGISGTVRGANGEALQNVEVTVTSPALPEKQRVTATGAKGLYRIAPLLEGTYTASFTVTGYDPERKVGAVFCASRADIIVTSGKWTEGIDVTLRFCREADKVVVVE